MEKLIQKSKKINEIKKQIGENRNLWNNKKKLIENTLEEIKNELKENITLFISTNYECKNFQSIVMEFSDNVDIVLKNGNNIKIPNIEGGYIIFGQIHNGQISIVIIPPHIEEIVDYYGDNIFCGNYNTSEITKELIINKVSTFLDNIIDFYERKSSHIKPIGY